MGKVIGIDINDTLRDFTGQLEYVVNKYYKYGVPKDEKYSLKKNPITNFNFDEYFDFKSKHEFYKFLYEEASLEVFGHADLTYDGVMRKFNNFIMDIEDDEIHKVILISREANLSIPSTYFFLSKTACKIKDIKFRYHYEDMWDGIDVMITANPILIQVKPENKQVIKVKTSYNADIESEYEIDKLEDFILNEELQKQILGE